MIAVGKVFAQGKFCHAAILLDSLQLRDARMTERLDDYLAPIGKVTIASATLEEVATRWGAMLSEDDLEETRYKNLTRGLEHNLTFLADRVKVRVSVPNKQSVLDMIEDARALKNKRNENIHGMWGELVDATSGDFVRVMRSRYKKEKATQSTQWDLSVPTIDDLNALATDLKEVAEGINERIAGLWDTDEEVGKWRKQRGL